MKSLSPVWGLPVWPGSVINSDLTARLASRNFAISKTSTCTLTMQCRRVHQFRDTRYPPHASPHGTGMRTPISQMPAFDACDALARPNSSSLHNCLRYPSRRVRRLRLPESVERVRCGAANHGSCRTSDAHRLCATLTSSALFCPSDTFFCIAPSCACRPQLRPSPSASQRHQDWPRAPF